MFFDTRKYNHALEMIRSTVQARFDQVRGRGAISLLETLPSMRWPGLLAIHLTQGKLPNFTCTGEAIPGEIYAQHQEHGLAQASSGYRKLINSAPSDHVAIGPSCLGLSTCIKIIAFPCSVSARMQEISRLSRQPTEPRRFERCQTVAVWGPRNRISRYCRLPSQPFLSRGA